MQSIVKTNVPIASGLKNQGPIRDAIPTDWKSIFIPRISFDMTRQELIDIVEKNLYMGSVSRIDFAPANNGSGRMAFIHMVEFTASPHIDAIRKEMETVGFWELPDELQFHSIRLRFVINKNPVPKTSFTMETLADALARQGYAIENTIQQVEMLNEGIMTMDADIQTISETIQEHRVAMEDEHDEFQQILDSMQMRIKKLEERNSYEENRANAAISQLTKALELLAMSNKKLEENESRFQSLEYDMVTLYDRVHNEAVKVDCMDMYFNDKFNAVNSDLHFIEGELIDA